jgi:hypothetical protein
MPGGRRRARGGDGGKRRTRRRGGGLEGRWRGLFAASAGFLFVLGSARVWPPWLAGFWLGSALSGVLGGIWCAEQTQVRDAEQRRRSRCL